MKAIRSIGGKIRAWSSQVSRQAGIAAMSVWLALQPRYWTRDVRDVLARQVLFTGVEALRFISVAAAICGLSVVLQAQVWLVRFGQSRMLGPILVALLIRELGPLLTILIVLGRSGTAMASELATMRIGRQVILLDAQGLDPFSYLVMPRVIGMTLSVCCLTFTFVFVSLLTGFLAGALTAASGLGPMWFARNLAQSLHPADVVVLLSKTVLAGLLVGSICCDAGLSAGRDLTEVPRATTQGQVRSLMAVFLIFLLISVAAYV